MSLPWVARWSGPAAALGGTLWTISAVLTALEPVGCVAAECDLPGRSMREGSALAGVLFIAAALLVGAGGAGLVDRARSAGKLGRGGRVGTGLAGISALALVVGGLVQELIYAGDFPLMPFFVIPGVLSLIVGLLLIAVTVLRAGVVPRWTGGLLVVGALAMVGFNDQDARVLLAVPLGIAWVAIGWVLWSGANRRNGAVSLGSPAPGRA